MPLNTEDKRTPTGITLHPEKTASYPSTPEKLQGGTGVGRGGGHRMSRLMFVFCSHAFASLLYLRSGFKTLASFVKGGILKKILHLQKVFQANARMLLHRSEYLLASSLLTFPRSTNVCAFVVRYLADCVLFPAAAHVSV